jgi:hypothetical protein
MAYGQPTAPGQQECLILTSNIYIGYQIATLLDGHWGQPHVVHNEGVAYSSIVEGRTGVVIADIDTEELGGLALLTYCNHQHPYIATFAITSDDAKMYNRMVRELGGCKDFFFLEGGQMRIDHTRGLPAQLLVAKLLANREITLTRKPDDDRP